MTEKDAGLRVPEILLPNESIDLKKWAVVACDQYTSQRDYWRRVEETVGEAPSTLHLVYPEVYLEDNDKDERIKRITSIMGKYIEDGVLKALPPCFVYVERTVDTGVRKGLMAAIDLEKYDYNEGSQTLIRATEDTVLDRLPPRICIRQGAILELPHIMVLIDDPECTVIEPVSENLSNKTVLYDFDLMMDGGHIKGYQIDDKTEIDRIFSALSTLADPAAFREKYQVEEDKGVLLFAVGDGNHSLATAKACWENLKKDLSPADAENHPARYALVELVNVHDEALVFNPIHRVLFHVEPEKVIRAIEEYYSSEGQLFVYQIFESESAAKLNSNRPMQHNILCVYADKWAVLSIQNPKSNLEAGTLQSFLDDYLKRNPRSSVDYIHGDDVVRKLGTTPGNMGFYLPVMKKEDLFKTVIIDGVLPKKTFSMGEAHEKRYYLECRKIVK